MTITIPIWATSAVFLISLVIFGGFLVFRHFDTKKYHPSLWQLAVRGLRRLANWTRAASVGLDEGYAHYRHSLQTSVLQLENERVLGTFVGRVRPSQTDDRTWNENSEPGTRGVNIEPAKESFV